MTELFELALNLELDDVVLDPELLVGQHLEIDVVDHLLALTVLVIQDLLFRITVEHVSERALSHIWSFLVRRLGSKGLIT